MLAGHIKAQRVLDLTSGKYNLQQSKAGQSFIEYFDKLRKERYNSSNNFGNWSSAFKHIVKFAKGKDLTFHDIDETWLIAFKHFLLHDKLTPAHQKLSQNSAHSYYNKVKAVLRQAFEEKIINENPAMRIKGIKQAETKREFLTWEEIEKLVVEPCPVKKLKEAFTFSVLTGLRWSDIIKLTWSEVRGSEKQGWYISFQQQKTRDYEVLPISQQARTLLGKSQEPDDRVFAGLRCSAYTNVALARWMMCAGIYRNITFHCARHTHATLLLSQGVDIYTVSKLLGHKNVKTTEIYAKVTNIKKNEAISKIPMLNFAKSQ